MQLVIFSIVLLGLNQAYAQSFGSCSANIPTLPEFDSSRYLGLWYEVERFDYIFEKNLQCVTAEYSVKNETAITVNNKGFNTKTQKNDQVLGYAYVPNSNEPNKLKVVLPVVFANFTVIENTGAYNVITTDYDNYALVYSCTQVVPSLLKFEISWILSRTKSLDQSTLNKVKEIAKQYKIDVTKYEVIDQSCN